MFVVGRNGTARHKLWLAARLVPFDSGFVIAVRSSVFRPPGRDCCVLIAARSCEPWLLQVLKGAVLLRLLRIRPAEVQD